MTDDVPAGWAGFAAPEEGLALLVPLSTAILESGAPLAEAAKERARTRYGMRLLASDILAGNAYLAVSAGEDGGGGVGTAAACLAGIARLQESRCLLAEVVRAGDSLDCHITALTPPETGDGGRRALQERLAARIGLAAREIVPGRLVRAAAVSE